MRIWLYPLAARRLRWSHDRTRHPATLAAFSDAVESATTSTR
jgi:hypothetical protein